MAGIPRNNNEKPSFHIRFEPVEEAEKKLSKEAIEAYQPIVPSKIGQGETVDLMDKNANMMFQIYTELMKTIAATSKMIKTIRETAQETDKNMCSLYKK